MTPSIPAQSKTESPEEPEEESLLSRRPYLRLLAMQFLFGISYSSFLLLPKYLTQELQANATEVGRAAAVALVAAALVAPLVGLLSRRFAARDVLLTAFFLEGASAFGFLFVDRVGFFLYFLRIFQGLAWAMVFNTTATLTAEFVPKRQMAQAIGYLGLAMLATNALAPLLAEPISTALGWKFVFLYAGFAALGGTTFVRTMKPVALRAGAESSGTLGLANLGPVHFASFLMGVGIGVNFAFTQPFALSLGSSRVGDFFLGYVVAAGLMRTVFGRAADRIGPARAAAVALGFYSLVVLATMALSTLTLAVIGAGIGACHGLMYPALTAAGMNRVAPESRKAFMGFFSGAFNLGCSVATLGLGPVADAKGFPMVFLIAGCVMTLGVLPLFAFARTPKGAYSDHQ